MEKQKVNKDFYLHLGLMAEFSAPALESVLEWMAYRSQSVILNYGEDNQLWECSWITDWGERYWGVEKTPVEAVKSCLNQVKNDVVVVGEGDDAKSN